LPPPLVALPLELAPTLVAPLPAELVLPVVLLVAVLPVAPVLPPPPLELPPPLAVDEAVVVAPAPPLVAVLVAAPLVAAPLVAVLDAAPLDTVVVAEPLLDWLFLMLPEPEALCVVFPLPIALPETEVLGRGLGPGRGCPLSAFAIGAPTVESRPKPNAVQPVMAPAAMVRVSIDGLRGLL
jgi:hypothetical protein